MKREDFKKIIKWRSNWRIDRRKGNYKLPNGGMLRSYIRCLVKSQLKLDDLGISKDGNMYCITPDKKYLLISTSNNERTDGFEQLERVDELVDEIIGKQSNM